MPFQGNENEMIVLDSIADLNKITFIFSIPKDPERFEKKQSIDLIFGLLEHQGEGSLFNCLNELSLITKIESDKNTCKSSCYKFFTIEIELTEKGMKNYQKVIALFFEYLRKVKEEWLANEQTIDFFNEMKLISNMDYDVFSPPD